MTNRLGVTLVVLSVVAVGAPSQDAADRSFDNAYWTNESPAQTAARVRKALRDFILTPVPPFAFDLGTCVGLRG